MTRNVKNILIAAHSGNQGGAELCLDTTLRHLDRSKHEATVFFGSEGPMAESARQLGMEVDILPLSWWMCYDRSLWQTKNLVLGSLPRIRRLVRHIRRNRIDLVYTNTAVIFEAAVAARLARVPHVWHVHEILAPAHMKPRTLPLGLITRWIGRWSDRVIFESASAREICRERIPPEKSLVVYNSVRFPETRPAVDSPAAKARFGLEPNRCVVAWAGRFSERKNPLLLIRAVARMKEAAGAVFLLAGEGPLEQEMTETIGRLGLHDACRIMPFQDDVRPLLEAADVLVLTSREESFGLVLVEAAAYGKPVVATRTQGPSEIVVDGQTGLLVDPGDEIDLAAKLDRLIANPHERETMGKAGASRAAELFSAPKNTRKIEEVFAELLDARQPNPRE